MLVNEKHSKEFYDFAKHLNEKAVVWVRDYRNNEWNIISSVAISPCPARVLNDIQDDYPHCDKMMVLDLDYTYNQMINILIEEEEGEME